LEGEKKGRNVIAYTKATDGGWTLITQQDYDEDFGSIASTNILDPQRISFQRS
jgi:hypothetical protein